MGKATGFEFNTTTGNIEMNAGDTGSCKWHITRKSGNTWPDTARMLWTVTSPGNEIVMQRMYRLDDQWDLGDGWIFMEFHNNDTDTWAAGTYSTEIRVDVIPTWDGTPSTARVVNALAAGAAKMIEGVPVRTLFTGTLKIDGVQGRI